MSIPTRHHYLAQSYQKLFWDEASQRIAVLELSTGKSRRDNPVNVCVERNLYRLNDDYSGEIGSTEIESPFFSNVDNLLLGLINNITFDNPQSIDRNNLATCISLLHLRCPEIMAKAEGYVSSQVKAAFISKIENALIPIPENLLENGEPVSSLICDIEKMIFTQGDDGKIAAIFQLQSHLADFFLRCKWRFFYSDLGGFITSDNPVVSISTEELKYYLVPLSSKWNLQCGLAEDTDVVFETASPQDVKYANFAIASGAKRWLLGENEELLQSVYLSLNEQNEY